MSKLKISNLYVNVGETEILKGLDLEINGGEVHAIMGPNGTGKSTLAAVIMGNPNYTVVSGEITLDGEDVLEMEVDERSRAGLFLGMQYPSEISGITNSDFIRSALRSHEIEEESLFKYAKRLEGAISELKMNKNMAHRYLNEGFSGGEKKRNEILQLKMLRPSIAVLDEIDSGLDIDALTVVGENLTAMVEERNDEMGVLLITHYQRLLNFIRPTHVHIMLNGVIVETGGMEIVEDLEVNGYETYKEKYGFVEQDETTERISVGACATHVGVNSNE